MEGNSQLLEILFCWSLSKTNSGYNIARNRLRSGLLEYCKSAPYSITNTSGGLWLGTRTGADVTVLIWRKGTPFEAMIGRTALSSDGLLGEVFLSCKANARRSVHSSQDHFIITLIISEWRDWRDTRGKWPLPRNPDRSWWHRHTN